MTDRPRTGSDAPFVIAIVAIVVLAFIAHSHFSTRAHAPTPPPAAAPTTSVSQPADNHVVFRPAPAPETPPSQPVTVAAPKNRPSFFSAEIAATNAELALQIAMKQMATNDPKGLVAWVQSILEQGGDFEGIDPAHVTSIAVDALIQSGNGALARDAVAQWMQIPNGPSVGNVAIEAAALDLAATSLPDATTWLKSLPAGTDRNYAMTTLAAAWVKTDPKAAMDWTMQLSEADGRTAAMERAFNDWAQADDESARQWIKGHLDDPGAETMVTSMVAESGLSYSNPQEAIVWADLISDPNARLENVEDIFLSWVRRDPDAAANYIKNDPTLTADEKKQVLQSFFGWKNAGGAN